MDYKDWKMHTPDDPRIFVFGSNLRGIHGGGAAYYAHKQLGAEWGVGQGPTGLTYALPTCVLPGVPLELSQVYGHTQVFLDWARLNPETRFFVSEVGCGLAGFKVEDVAPFFEGVPSNCDLPPAFEAVLAARIKENANG